MTIYYAGIHRTQFDGSVLANLRAVPLGEQPDPVSLPVAGALVSDTFGAQARTADGMTVATNRPWWADDDRLVLQPYPLADPACPVPSLGGEQVSTKAMRLALPVQIRRASPDVLTPGDDLHVGGVHAMANAAEVVYDHSARYLASHESVGNSVDSITPEHAVSTAIPAGEPRPTASLAGAIDSAPEDQFDGRVHARMIAR